jgi:RimJ/RimL family protein N-acetyltransferase
VAKVTLRPVEDPDLDSFFAHYQDPVAAHMAAFTAKDPFDRESHDARWARIRNDENVTVRTIFVGDEVSGHVASFVMDGRLEVTYWLDRECWGSGYGTTALQLFLSLMTDRPLHARAARDNLGSVRILEKSGFRLIGVERGFANARDADIDEVVMRLD